jgi:hypothetical protein
MSKRKAIEKKNTAAIPVIHALVLGVKSFENNLIPSAINIENPSNTVLVGA